MTWRHARDMASSACISLPGVHHSSLIYFCRTADFLVTAAALQAFITRTPSYGEGTALILTFSLGGSYDCRVACLMVPYGRDRRHC